MWLCGYPSDNLAPYLDGRVPESAVEEDPVGCKDGQSLVHHHGSKPDDLVGIIKVMEQHLSVEGNVCDITLHKVGRHIVKVIGLFEPQLRCWPDGIMQFPPHNIAKGVLWAVHVRVAIRCNVVGSRWSICFNR